MAEECCTCQQTIHWTCQPIVPCCLRQWHHNGIKYGGRNNPTTLVRSSTLLSELASIHALNLAHTWLGSTGQHNTDLRFTDHSVIDLFAIVTDHHNSSKTKNTHLDQAPKSITYQKQLSTTAVLPQTEMAVSEGGTLTLRSKRPLITAADSVPPASQDTTSTSQRQRFNTCNHLWTIDGSISGWIKTPTTSKFTWVRTTLIKTHQSVTTKSTQTSTCCMGYKNQKICVRFNHSLLICQPCLCSRSWATNTCNIFRSHDQMFWRVTWTLWWYNDSNPFSVL